VRAIARIYEHLMPVERAARYEDPLDKYLLRHGLGTVTGSGTQMGNGTPIVFVQIEVDLDNGRDVDLVCAKLDECGAPRGSELHLVTDDGVETRIFGTLEGVAVFIDGKTLPMDVYASSDVNVVIAELQASAAELNAGVFRSYWEGSEETALFFYGNDANGLASALRVVLLAHPLCQNARLVRRYGNHPDGPLEERMPFQR
jgi:hypothetical protein